MALRIWLARISLGALAALLALPALGCGSRSARGEVNSSRRLGERQLELGNRQADRGDFEGALFFIDEALLQGVLADDAGLRARAGLSRGNVLFYLRRQDEAEAVWADALAEAGRSGSRELLALARVHIARGRLLSPGGGAHAAAVRDEVAADRALLRGRGFVAFSWTVTARAEAELGRFAEAEAAARQSLRIHERNRQLELAAFDWFSIASFRSRSGDFAGARQALEASIALDRRVENSWGLASSWRAMGDVETRAGNPAAAAAAYARSAEIFAAMGDAAAAEESLSRSP